MTYVFVRSRGLAPSKVTTISVHALHVYVLLHAFAVLDPFL